jgi:hypothetical protein
MRNTTGGSITQPLAAGFRCGNAEEAMQAERLTEGHGHTPDDGSGTAGFHLSVRGVADGVGGTATEGGCA